MPNIVVVGAQWGDEGKAKITDLLSNDADIIIRYQGGCNAGHTVVTGGEKYKFHLIPSGVLYPEKICIIGAGTVINPEVLTEEINDLTRRGISAKNLKISPLAHVTLPYHIDIDGSSEKSLGDKKIGTTNRGIGPTYSDKFARTGIRIQDLYDEEALNERLDIVLPQKNLVLEKIYGLKPYSKQGILEYCKKYAALLNPYVCEEIPSMLRNALKDNKNILFEGAQGAMLDIDYGTYPFVTSSNPIAGGACTGSGVGPTKINEVIGISKAYVTRVGEGPFVTELNDELGQKIRDIGQEFGTTTGRPRRCGWFDAVVARHAVLINGLTGMAITKLDVFDGFDEIKICVAYKDKRNGKVYEDYPTNTYISKYLEPVYEMFEGWQEDLSSIGNWEKLPENTRKYLQKIEELIEIPVTIVSIGPAREQTIMLKNPVTGKKVEKFDKTMVLTLDE